jgi:hypothetical protein
LDLRTHGEKQQLKNTLMGMNSQGEIWLPNCPIPPAQIDDFRLKYCSVKENAKVTTSGSTKRYSFF